MNIQEYELMFRNEERHWYFRGKRRIVGRLLRSSLPSGPLNILDAGCGTGGILGDLQTMGRVTAIDPFHGATVFCSCRGFGNVAQASVLNLPFRDHSFDLITSLDVIEHVDDDVAALREMKRVLRPGGILMLTVPASMFLWSGHDVALHHRRRYDRNGFRKKVMDSGFSILRCTAFNTILFPLVAAVRIFRRSLGIDHSRSDTSTVPMFPLNSLLYLLMDLESRLLTRCTFAFGVSLACVATKMQDD